MMQKCHYITALDCLLLNNINGVYCLHVEHVFRTDDDGRNNAGIWKNKRADRRYWNVMMTIFVGWCL